MTLDYKAYHMIFLVGAIAAGVMLVTTILLFILMRIPAVIGDLTGRTARREIEDIRNQNTRTGTKTYKSSAVNKARGKITDKISPSGNLRRRHPSDDFVGAMSTAKIGPQGGPAPVSQPAAETTILEPPAAETTVLAPEQMYDAQSASFAEPAGETTVLSSPVGAPAAPAAVGSSSFTIEYEITFIHTNELIR